tara:strand:+ start:590 stop:826 length:237 start_codon:yes stop_codon:yes gene_type:complete
MEEVLNFCGYKNAYEIIVANMTHNELMSLLESLIDEDNSGHIEEIVEEIASEQYGWVDKEKIKADADDYAYEEYRDNR